MGNFPSRIGLAEMAMAKAKRRVVKKDATSMSGTRHDPQYGAVSFILVLQMQPSPRGPRKFKKKQGVD
jgi:hypothetical protein